MQQLTQKLKNGHMQILEVPVPAIVHGSILVRNHYSLISAGTEGSTVKTARGSLLAKAKERPQQVKQVVDTLLAQGVTQTYRAVMKKLDAYSALGYSTAGEVVAVAAGVREFKVGDLVACAGLSACHAEYVTVSVNLCVKLQPGADLKQAAYNTLGAIAMQGVRQADLRLGESCAVIGMGLLGQLTALILRASGIKVIGIDIDPSMIAIASQHCLEVGLVRDDPGIEGKIQQITNGLGCDAVIITAATGSLDPINFAGAISRKRGTVVVVGAVPTGFERDPYYYRKELQVRMSCSYGPGRYDPAYEEQGHDYPAAYVRWTENRNMQAFQELIHRGVIDVRYLTTHTFPLAQATTAYDMLMDKSEPFIGILIEYDRQQEVATSSYAIPLGTTVSREKEAVVGIGFIGAGSYAQSHLLPNIPKDKGISLVGVMTATGTGSRSVGDRFGFEFCSSNANDIIGHDRITTLVIASRHDTHRTYLLQALQAGKHVFVEKPLCLTEQELSQITAAYGVSQGITDSVPLLMVGYNRRFSPLSQYIRSELGTGPMAMVYRINAGAIPADSWIQDAMSGGGRIIGEVCHFVDYLTFLNGSLPVSVYGIAMAAPGNLHDTVTITLAYQNGSVGTICYYANGDKGCPKERVEIFTNNCTVVLDDFKSVTMFAKGKKKEKKLASQDKGQAACVHSFLASIGDGSPPVIPFQELRSTSLVTFRIIESLSAGIPLPV